MILHNNDEWVQVLLFLDAHTIVHGLLLVNTAVHQQTSTEFVWKMLMQRDFSSIQIDSARTVTTEEEEVQTYKAKYRKLYTCFINFPFVYPPVNNGSSTQNSQFLVYKALVPVRDSVIRYRFHRMLNTGIWDAAVAQPTLGMDLSIVSLISQNPDVINKRIQFWYRCEPIYREVPSQSYFRNSAILLALFDPCAPENVLTPTNYIRSASLGDAIAHIEQTRYMSPTTIPSLVPLVPTDAKFTVPEQEIRNYCEKEGILYLPIREQHVTEDVRTILRVIRIQPTYHDPATRITHTPNGPILPQEPVKGWSCCIA